MTLEPWAAKAGDDLPAIEAWCCLTMLRACRDTYSDSEDVDPWALWNFLEPFACLEPEALKAVFVEVMRTGVGEYGVHVDDDEKNEAEIQKWLDSAVTAGAFPERTPSCTADLLGWALIFDLPLTRQLFDAVDKRLVGLIKTRPASTDLNILLLTELLGLSPVESRFLSVSCSWMRENRYESFLKEITNKSHRIEAMRRIIEVQSEREVRLLLGPDGKLARSGLYDPYTEARSLLGDMRLTENGEMLVSEKVSSHEDLSRLVITPLEQTASASALRWPHLEERGPMLEAFLRNAMRTKTPGANILLYGPSGTGKTEYAKQLIQSVSALGYSVAESGDDEDARLNSLRLSQAFAPKGESVLLLDEAEDIFREDYYGRYARSSSSWGGNKAAMNGMLERNAVPVIWISNQIEHMDVAYRRRFSVCIEFPAMSRVARRSVVHSHLAPLGCSDEFVDQVADYGNLCPGLIATAAKFARVSDASASAAERAANFVLTEGMRALGEEKPAEFSRRVTRFDMRYLNVAGVATAPAVLAGLQRTGCGALLLSGPPGTGKTQLASEIAQQLGRTLVYKTAADINTKWFGESERAVASMFTEADPATQVLFLDEADTLMASRGNTGQRPNVAVTAEFLRRMEVFRGVFVCATNYKESLDAALMRRFVFRLSLLPLNALQREQMFCETALGWLPGSSEPLPVLDMAVKQRLRRMDQLTPGDFSNVLQRMRVLQASLGVDDWLAELQAEHDAKPLAGRVSMGFV